MPSLEERLAAMRGKQEAADKQKKEAEEKTAAEKAAAEGEARRGELPKEREAVTAELATAEQAANEAKDAATQAEAFAAEQGENLDQEAKAEIDAIKAEAAEAGQKMELLKAEIARIDQELGTLAKGAEVPAAEAAPEIPAETAVAEAPPEDAGAAPEVAAAEAAAAGETLKAEAAALEGVEAVDPMAEKIAGFHKKIGEEVQVVEAVKETTPMQTDRSLAESIDALAEDLNKVKGSRAGEVLAGSMEIIGEKVLGKVSKNVEANKKTRGFDLRAVHSMTRVFNMMDKQSPELFGKYASFFLKQMTEKFKGKGLDEIRKALYAQGDNAAVYRTLNPIFRHLAKGEELPEDLKKAFVEALPILEANDASEVYEDSNSKFLTETFVNRSSESSGFMDKAQNKAYYDSVMGAIKRLKAESA